MNEMSMVMDIAKQAGQIICDGWTSNSLEISLKGDINPVTEIDKKVEDLVSNMLKKAFPLYGILAEESREIKGSVNARWIIDPLDGTTNFIRHYPSVAVSIALEKENELVLGLVYNPIINETYFAEKGKGAFCNGRQIHVSEISQLKSSVLASGFPYDAWDNFDNNTIQWSKMITKCVSLRCDGSAALDLCRVAAGQFDGYWEKGLSPWDVAAGSVIVREAGGLVTDYSEGSNFLFGGEIIAANPALHREIAVSLSESYSKNIK
jgi:myo-inositol-1(or 4)-monophosphatase